MQANINGVLTGFDDFGQGPAVLFIHDFPLNRKKWQKQVEPLVNSGFRVVLADLRGFGESWGGDAPVGIQTYSSEIICLLNYLGIGRAVVCGLSLGGYVLFDLMERYPQRIAGACLVASRPVSDDLQERAKRTELRSAIQAGRVDEGNVEFFDMLFSGRNEDVFAELMSDVRSWLQSTETNSLNSGLCAVARRKDDSFLLRSLKIPTLLVGAEQDSITYHKHPDIMARHLPNGYRSNKLKNGLVNLERADEFNAHLLDFLQTLAPRKGQKKQTVALQSVG